MTTKKRTFPKGLKIYFPRPEDEDLYKSLQLIAQKSGLSVSRLALLLLEHGLPQVEDALKVFQAHRGGRSSVKAKAK